MQLAVSYSTEEAFMQYMRQMEADKKEREDERRERREAQENQNKFFAEMLNRMQEGTDSNQVQALDLVNSRRLSH
jgi:nucleosome binding factor SPN SPT16 subunit